MLAALSPIAFDAEFKVEAKKFLKLYTIISGKYPTAFSNISTIKFWFALIAWPLCPTLEALILKTIKKNERIEKIITGV